MSARARIHAMFHLGETAETELDTRLDALVAEVRNEDAATLRARAAHYPTRRIFAAGLRHGALLLAKAAMGRNTSETATAPAFFEVDHTYAREHHGQRITFVVTAVSVSPDGQRTVAHGWRTDPYSDWEPTDSDDLCGWADVTGEVTP